MASVPDQTTYELRPEVTAEKLTAAAGAAPGAAAARAKPVDRVLLDTFDGRLYRRGLTLWKQGQRGQNPQLHLEGTRPSGVTAPVAPAQAGRIVESDVPAGSLRDALAPNLGGRALLDRARVRVITHPYDVRNGDGKTVVRLAIEDAEVVTPGTGTLPLARRLHVRPVLGYDRDLARTLVRLQKAGARPQKLTMVEEALAVLGVPPAGVSSSVEVPLDRAMTAELATKAICRRLAEIVEANLPGTIDDLDPEFLHDLRVAIRRSRSVLREMRGVLSPETTRQVRTDLRWIQEITGPTRDLDVMLIDWPAMESQVPQSMRSDLEPLRNLLREDRDRHFKAMRRHLRSRRYAEAWERWRLAISAGKGRPGPDSAKPIGVMAGKRIVAVYKRMVEMGSAIDDTSPGEALHDLRKRGKELRYLLELFGGLWPAEAVKPLVSALKGLQDTLGHFQDDEIQIAELRSLGPTLATVPGGTDSLIALGFVIEDLAVSQAKGRSDFARRFADFSAPANRELVASTFGPAGRKGAQWR